MRRAWFAQFFEADGPAGVASGKAPADDPADRNEESDSGGKPDDEATGGSKSPDEDVAGLKSALEKERKARKDLAQQIRELREIKDRASEDERKLQEYQAKLAEYEFRDKRDAALDDAIAKVTRDGTFTVDRAKAARLAGKLGNAGTLEADVAEIVDLLKAPAAEPEQRRREPVMKGQPSGTGARVTTELPYHEWAQLRKADPEAYAAMLKARRQKGPFRIMGS